MSLRVLASTKEMSDGQSKKRRWFSYKSSYSREVTEDQFVRLLAFKESYLTIFVDLRFGILFELVSKSLSP